jgi:hypothetical protein
MDQVSAGPEACSARRLCSASRSSALSLAGPSRTRLVDINVVDINVVDINVVDINARSDLWAKFLERSNRRRVSTRYDLLPTEIVGLSAARRDTTSERAHWRF